MPAWSNLVGLLLVAAGHALANCAFAANRFFSALVRIQRDHGHTVVDSGPYRFVKAPRLPRVDPEMFGTGFAPGSWWALDVAAVVSLVVAVRTAVEDRTLQRELDGYAEDAARVRFRLVLESGDRSVRRRICMARIIRLDRRRFRRSPCSPAR